jgi:ABC-type nitrate/sulfonate/bicarbonate transport system substrate-binding protein
MLRREFVFKSIAAGTATFCMYRVGKAQRTTPLQRINIVSTSGTTNLVISALINQMGYLRELGVTANLVNVADGNKVVAALISGDMDICPTSGFTQVLAANEKGAPLKIIAGGAIKNFNTLFSGNPNVKTLKDLEGRSVGIGALGSQLHQTMIALFRKYGVDSTKVKFANVGASVDVFKAVMARVVDAGCAEYWLQRGSGLHIVEHGKTFESLPDFVNQAAFTSERAIAQKRELLVRTLAAYARAYRFIMSGDSEKAFMSASAVALGQKSDPQAARDQWQFYREIQPFAVDLVLAENRIRYMQELNVTTGTQKTLLPYGRVTDMSLARDALKLLL